MSLEAAVDSHTLLKLFKEPFEIRKQTEDNERLIHMHRGGSQNKTSNEGDSFLVLSLL